MTNKLQKINICIFSPKYFPHIGGIEKYVWKISIHLINLGHKITIVTFNTESSFPEEILDNIKIYRLPVKVILNDRFPIPVINNDLFILLDKLSKDDFDFVIINTRFFLSSIMGLIFAKLKHIPSLLIEHGSGHFTANNKIFDKLGHVYEHIITYVIKLLTNNFFGVSKACNNWLLHFNIKASGIIYNGIDVNESKKTSYSFRETYKVSKDQIVITFLARLIREKGVLTLIKAFLRLNKDYDNACLFIAGTGPLYEMINRNYSKEKNLVILGGLEHTKAMNLLKETDIVVIPSNFPEGLPTTLLEAGISRCAVIATPKGGVKEVIIDKNHGIIIEPNSESQIINALNLLINNSSYRNEIANNLHDIVVDNFNWEDIANKIETTIYGYLGAL